MVVILPIFPYRQPADYLQTAHSVCCVANTFQLVVFALKDLSSLLKPGVFFCRKMSLLLALVSLMKLERQLRGVFDGKIVIHVFFLY